MAKVFLVERVYEFESVTTLSAWTTRDAAVQEIVRIEDPEDRCYYTVKEMDLQGEKCGHPGCSGTLSEVCCDSCRSN